MRINILLASLFLLLLTHQISGQSINNRFQIDENLSVKEIDEGVFLVSHSFPWQANSLAIRFSVREIFLIDTPYTEGATEKLITWLTDGEPDRQKITAINTHFHMDNLGGNGYLKQIGATIYGSEMTVQLLQERGLGNGMEEILESMEDQNYREYWLTHPLVPPTTTFDIYKGLTLTFGDEEVEIFYPGSGHTPDNVVVYYPKKKILFGGCLIKSMENSGKGNVGDAVEQEWAESVRKVKDRYRDAKRVIPGHGSEGGRELLDHTIQIVQ